MAHKTPKIVINTTTARYTSKKTLIIMLISDTSIYIQLRIILLEAYSMPLTHRYLIFQQVTSYPAMRGGEKV
jgi:hypothetical protein